jgi:hypothetical protein
MMTIALHNSIRGKVWMMVHTNNTILLVLKTKRSIIALSNSRSRPHHIEHICTYVCIHYHLVVIGCQATIKYIMNMYIMGCKRVKFNCTWKQGCQLVHIFEYQRSHFRFLFEALEWNFFDYFMYSHFVFLIPILIKWILINLVYIFCGDLV